jgi:Holliday junction resolvase RusA-like endonuclease
MSRWTTQQLLDHPKFGNLVLQNENRRQASRAVAKQAVCDEPLAAQKGKAADAGRVSVRITSYRRRLTDPDNLIGKYFLDCCRYAGFLRDDSANDIGYEITQSKVKAAEDERTEIEITLI